MAAGSTMRSKSSAEMPSASAASRRLLLSSSALWAIAEALS